MSTYHKMQRVRWAYEKMVTEIMKDLTPHMEKVYKKLKKEKSIYDIDKTRMENIHELWTDGSNYAGIIEDGCKRGNMMYIHAENAQFVVIFNKRSFTDDCHTKIGKGMRIYRVFNPIDVKCIEESWRVDSTLKWCTKLDLTRETFTDETEFSRVVSDGLTVCERPTIKRLIQDQNTNAFTYYPPIYDGGRHTMNCCGDMGLVQYAAACMSGVGERLEIKGCEF